MIKVGPSRQTPLSCADKTYGGRIGAYASGPRPYPGTADSLAVSCSTRVVSRMAGAPSCGGVRVLPQRRHVVSPGELTSPQLMHFEEFIGRSDRGPSASNLGGNTIVHQSGQSATLGYCFLGSF